MDLRRKWKKHDNSGLQMNFSVVKELTPYKYKITKISEPHPLEKGFIS